MISKRAATVVDALLKQHRVVILVVHICLILISLGCAWLLLFDFTLPQVRLVLWVAPILVLFRLFAMDRCKLLHGNWRYTGVDDATEILKAISLSSVAFFVTVRFLLHLHALPVSIYVMEAVMSACVLAGVRLGFRVLAEAANRMPFEDARRQLIIVGAGFAAQMIIRELRQGATQYWVVGCVDDDKSKLRQKIQGKRVLGTVEQLPEIAAQYGVREVLIAVPSATGAQMRRFVSICEKAGLKSSTVPTLQELISGRADINELHEVNVNDLLGREAVQIDLDSVRHIIAGKVVLVTGAAGSIGSELCRQILEYEPSGLVCLDQNETGLFYLEMELRRKQGRASTVYCVADYTDQNRMSRTFSTHQIQIVFHAAAYKHVPLMEQNPRVALENNVFGLTRFLDVAQTLHCEAFVLISSDKAVNPTNVMGCTKRLGELILASRKNGNMRCVSVRFGNVLGSQGSVVPVFQKQIAEKQCLTVTHPEIARFFMTISEAVSLVLQASAIGRHGDTLVLDMGEPVRIVDLARTLIRLSGKTEKDVEIIFTGLRPGEKLYEELFYEDEQIFATSCDKIKRTAGMILSWPELKSRLDDLYATIYTSGDDELRAKIQNIVPEYSYEGHHAGALAIATAAAVSSGA
jgi:FlaA1/EpsC-like NDP-sugar epimerase